MGQPFRRAPEGSQTTPPLVPRPGRLSLTLALPNWCSSFPRWREAAAGGEGAPGLPVAPAPWAVSATSVLSAATLPLVYSPASLLSSDPCNQALTLHIRGDTSHVGLCPRISACFFSEVPALCIRHLHPPRCTALTLGPTWAPHPSLAPMASLLRGPLSPCQAPPAVRSLEPGRCFPVGNRLVPKETHLQKTCSSQPA